MSRIKQIFSVFLLVLFAIMPQAYSQTTNQAMPAPTPVYLVISGRLAVENHGQEEWLVLHSRDAKTYLIIGDYRDQLKDALLKLGANNLVYISAELDGSSRTSCTNTYKYEENVKGEKNLKTNIECIRYYTTKVRRIVETRESDERIPAPARDTDEETQVLKRVSRQSLTPMIMGEIYGKIAVLNIKSAFKTIEIQNSDTASPINYVTLVITPDTRIAKKIGKEEPMGLSPEGLKVGQEITATYSKDELKAQALFITITKE